MDTALAILGVAFAAFSIWLGVRIVNRRERWAMSTLAAALVVGCPLAFVAKRAQAARQAQQQAERAYEQLLKARTNGTPLRLPVPGKAQVTH